MKLGIITFHRAHNCGAMLQCVALQTVLERMGHEVVVVDCNDVGDGLRDRLFVPLSWRRAKQLAHLLLNRLNPARRRYARFRRRFMNLSPACMGRIQDVACDCYVLGSDQVLNPFHMENQRNVFLMTDIPSSVRRIAYAASFGIETLPCECLRPFRDALACFSALGIREDSGVAICRGQLGLVQDVCQTLDPTLLLDSSDYRRLEFSVRTPDRYVLVYHMGWCLDATLSLARRVARMQDARVVVTSLVGLRPKVDDVMWLFGSPDQFLSLVKNACCVITTSFHGAAFSVVYQRPFISVIPLGLTVKGRLVSLLRQLGLENRAFREGDSVSDDELGALIDIDFGKVCQRLRPLRESSMAFLRKAVLC